MIGLGRVEVTGGFLLLLAWLNYMDRSFLVPMALLACSAHELGHILMIRLLGGSIKQFRLTAIGGELVLDRPLSYWQEQVFGFLYRVLFQPFQQNNLCHSTTSPIR